MPTDDIIYPIGTQTFEILRRNNMLYVDKTAYIHDLVRKGRYYFLSRPRRFGKSLLLSTIEAYFRGKKELFEGLAIAKAEESWTEHPIVRIDFASMKTTNPLIMLQQINRCLRNIAIDYGVEIDTTLSEPEDLLSSLLKALHDKYQIGVVVLIDEYDKGIIDTLIDESAYTQAMEMLRPFFSVLKSHDSLIRFAFITGVSRFRNTTLFSGFNNPEDISFQNAYAAICGITHQELLTYCAPGISQLAENHACSIQRALDRLHEMYDGYRFTRKKEYVFNPFSVLSALKISEFDSFWIMTGTSKILTDYLKESCFSLEDLTTRWVPIEKLSSPYTRDNPLSLFFQTGYLTLQDVRESGSCLLRIPNREVQKALVELLIPEFVNPKARHEITSIRDNLAEALNHGDVQSMMNILRTLLASVPYHEIDKVLEKHLHLCVYIVFMMLGVSAQCEIASSAGRVDLVATTTDYVYIMEFKLDRTAQKALSQIDDRGYAIAWENDKRKVFKIGINFSSKTHTIDSWVVQ